MNDAKNDRPDQTFNLNTLVATSDEHFIIQYIFPEQKNLQAIGLDIGSESMRKQAALNAAINNTTQLTAPLTLVQANKLSQQGFLILVPIYKTITISDNKKQRLNELLGWAYSPLLIDKILDSLSHFDENQLTISDINNNTETDFFSYGIKSKTNDYQLTKIIKLMGRTWKITIDASDAFIYNLHLPSRYQAMLMALSPLLAVCL
ncbi:CHASE domain-containing protein [Pseudoalteromonas sp. NCIMB_1079]|uniref:CHASE domain-containing protein n=1 Tax=Pseudoalteromonas sp. NCIMB 1079 TaxID=3142847 RepID=UPI00339C6F6E